MKDDVFSDPSPNVAALRRDMADIRGNLSGARASIEALDHEAKSFNNRLNATIVGQDSAGEQIEQIRADLAALASLIAGLCLNMSALLPRATLDELDAWRCQAQEIADRNR